MPAVNTAITFAPTLFGETWSSRATSAPAWADAGGATGAVTTGGHLGVAVVGYVAGNPGPINGIAYPAGATRTYYDTSLSNPAGITQYAGPLRLEVTGIGATTQSETKQYEVRHILTDALMYSYSNTIIYTLEWACYALVGRNWSGYNPTYWNYATRLLIGVDGIVNLPTGNTAAVGSVALAFHADCTGWSQTTTFDQAAYDAAVGDQAFYASTGASRTYPNDVYDPVTFSVSSVVFSRAAIFLDTPIANCHDTNVEITVVSTNVPKDGQHEGDVNIVCKPMSVGGIVYYWFVEGANTYYPPTYDMDTTHTTTMTLDVFDNVSPSAGGIVFSGGGWTQEGTLDGAYAEQNLLIVSNGTSIGYGIVSTQSPAFSITGSLTCSTVEKGLITQIDWTTDISRSGSFGTLDGFHITPPGTTEASANYDGDNPYVVDAETGNFHIGYWAGFKYVNIYGYIYGNNYNAYLGSIAPNPALVPFPSPGQNWPPGSGYGPGDPTTFSDSIIGYGGTLDDIRTNSVLILQVDSRTSEGVWISQPTAQSIYGGEGFPDLGEIAANAGATESVGLSAFSATVSYHPLLTEEYWAIDPTVHVFTNQIRGWNGGADARAFEIPSLLWEETTYSYTNSQYTPHFIDWSHDGNAMYVLVQYDNAINGTAPFAVWKADLTTGDVTHFGTPFLGYSYYSYLIPTATVLYPRTILASNGSVFVGGSIDNRPYILSLPTTAGTGDTWNDSYHNTGATGYVSGLVGVADSSTQYAGVTLTSGLSYILSSTSPLSWAVCRTTENYATETIRGVWGHDAQALFTERGSAGTDFRYTSDGGSTWELLTRCTDNIEVFGGLEFNNWVVFPVHLYDTDTLAYGALEAAPRISDVVINTNVTDKVRMWGGPWFGVTSGNGFMQWGHLKGALSYADLQVPAPPGPSTVVTTITGESAGGWLVFSDGGMLNGWDETYGVCGGPYVGIASIAGLWAPGLDTGEVHVQGSVPCTYGEITSVTVRVNGTCPIYVPPGWVGVGPEPPAVASVVVYDRIWSLPDGVVVTSGDFSADIDVTSLFVGQVTDSILLGLSYFVDVYPYNGGSGSAPGGFIPTLTVDSIVVTITVNAL